LELFFDLGYKIPNISPERYEEVNGLAEAIGMDTQTILILTYLYDLDPLCTSIVARMANGTLIHGRNLDFPGADVMRSIAYVG